jgi:hypothetical protein
MMVTNHSELEENQDDGGEQTKAAIEDILNWAGKRESMKRLWERSTYMNCCRLIVRQTQNRHDSR